MKEKRLNITINKTIQKLLSFDYITKEYKMRYNSNWPEMPDQSYQVIIAGYIIY